MREHPRPTAAPRLRLQAWAAILLVAAIAGCSDDDGSPAAAETTTSSTTAAATPSDPAPETTTTALPPGADVEPVSCENLDPCTASARIPNVLEHGATVVVTIEGWPPGQVVGAAQCADPDAYPDGEVEREDSGLPAPPFCDTTGFQRVRSDEEGRVRIEHEVVAGSRMVERTEASVTCDAEHACVLNVFTADEGRFNAQNPRVVFRLDFA